MRYTIEQLIHLRNIRAIGFDNSFKDVEYNTPRGFFICETDKLFEWIEKMEKKDKIREMLDSHKIPKALLTKD